MAIRKTWIAAAAVLLAAGLVMTGCPNGNNVDREDIPGVDGLEDLDPTVDQTKGTVSLVPGYDITDTEVGNLDILRDESVDGVVFWEVNDGELSFEFDKDGPSISSNIATFLKDFLGDDGINSNLKVTVTGDGKNLSNPDTFLWNDGRVSRSVTVVDNEANWTKVKMSDIQYIYADDAVTLSRGEVEDGLGSIYKALTLEFKKGWNLMQIDSYYTPETAVAAFKIADKNVPWTVDYYGNSSGSKGIFGKKR